MGHVKGDFYTDKLRELSEREHRTDILLSWAGSDATGGVVEDGWRIEHFKHFTGSELTQFLDYYSIVYDYAACDGHFCVVVSKTDVIAPDADSADQCRIWANAMREQWGAGTRLYSFTADSYGRVIVVFSVVDTVRLPTERRD